jgi:hypothetical protein
MWIPYRCVVLLLVLNIVQGSCVKSSLTLRSATDVTLKARGRMCYIILIFSSWYTNITTLLVCACILMCLCVVGLCHKFMSFLSEEFAESMLNVHKRVFICKTT